MTLLVVSSCSIFVLRVWTNPSRNFGSAINPADVVDTCKINRESQSITLYRIISYLDAIDNRLLSFSRY